MLLRVVALAYAFGLVLATAAWAASPKPPTPVDQTPATPVAANAPLPISWVPDWLMEPLARAIADATDPRERKKS